MSSAELPTRNLRLVDAPGLEALNRPWLFVHSIRTIFLVCILLVSVVYQIHLGNFVNVEIWLPVYAVLLANFFLNSVYLFFFDKLERQSYWNGVLFGLDIMAITLLIYFTGTSQSLFLFLYLVNLILAGLVFKSEGAWLLALWTSMCFSTLLIVSPEISGQSLYFSLTVNNIAFAAVTFLSGRLSSQLVLAGSRLQEAHSDLQVLQNLNELIVNNITTGIVVVSRSGFVQFFNPPASTILAADHFQQIKIQDILPELGWPWESITSDESLAFERREVRFSRDESTFKILEVVAARFKDADAKLRGWLLLIDDRTDEKMREETYRQQEKLAAVGQLAAGIAHEIRNPLASISGSIQLMMGGPQNHTDENMKLMKIVDKEIDRLNGLITEFLEYVRPEKKANQRINLNNVIREVIEALQFNPKLRKDIEQKFELKAQSEILGNRDKLKQALLNFAINAYQAMDKTERPELEIETHDERDLVVLIIRDNGCGIKAENISRIFEPFHTTKSNGTGLGLAVTHKILQAHEARVMVDSTVGEGTKFVIEFPAFRDVHTEDLIPLKQGAKG
jgi:two-component system sensor histidine kinase PilS (NtrC family)